MSNTDKTEKKKIEQMEDYTAALTREITDSVENTIVKTSTDDEDEDELETSEEIKPKAYFEFALILTEHRSVVKKFNAKKSRKTKVVPLPKDKTNHTQKKSRPVERQNPHF